MFSKASLMAGLSMAKKAAAKAAQSVKTTVQELGDVPSSVECPGCEGKVAVPPTIFDWKCGACSEGKTNAGSVKKCPITACQQPRPEGPTPVVTCGKCQQEVPVPSSNAWKHVNTAKVATVTTATSAKNWTEAKIAELKRVPDHVTCSSCRIELAVPPQVFHWQCAGCGAQHDEKEATAEKCSACEAPRFAAEGGLQPPLLQCPNCTQITAVPFSNAKKHVNAAGKATKDAYVSVSTTVSSEYKRLKATPTEFNCSKCAQLLVAPVDEATGEVVKRIVCPKCQQESSVPTSVAQNSLRKTTTNAKKTATKLYYDTAKKSYLTCDSCSTAIPLPTPEDGQMAPAYVQCPKCKKEFSPRANSVG
jgi:hypothetical protein